MNNLVAYKAFIRVFHRMKYFGVAVAILGLVVGVLVGGTSRIVIWVVVGSAAVWTFTTGFFQQRRYQRFLDGVQLSDAGPIPSTPVNDTSPVVNLAGDGQHDHSIKLPGTQSASPESAAREAVRVAAMLSFERQFTGLALASAAISVVGIGWGLFLVGPARVVVIGCSVVGGFLLSGFFLLTKKRLRTGPKAEYLREGWQGYR
jgi:hypothetical protein